MFVKDENLRYVFFNKAMQKFLGTKPDRIMNSTDSELIEPGHASLCTSTDTRAREEKRMIIDEEYVGKKNI